MPTKLKLLLDENIGRIVTEQLCQLGYDAVNVIDTARGATDIEVLTKALEEKRILVTLDKDFGRLIFYNSNKYVGVIFLRLNVENSKNIFLVLLNILTNYSDKIPGTFITATDYDIRVR